MGRLPDSVVALQSPCAEGLQSPTKARRHLFVMAIVTDGEEEWIVDALCLQRAKHLATLFVSPDYIIHSVTATWPTKIVHTTNCAHLAVQAASWFLYCSPQGSRFLGHTGLFDKTDSAAETRTTCHSRMATAEEPN